MFAAFEANKMVCIYCLKEYDIVIFPLFRCNLTDVSYESFLYLFILQLSSYAIREMEEYKNFCDRTKDQRPLPEEIVGVSHLLKAFIRLSIA